MPIAAAHWESDVPCLKTLTTFAGKHRRETRNEIGERIALTLGQHSVPPASSLAQ